eukprot:Skav225422  [mRNA]  locus=scaffold680:131381:140761:- [translate_table: standard]
MIVGYCAIRLSAEESHARRQQDHALALHRPAELEIQNSSVESKISPKGSWWRPRSCCATHKDTVQTMLHPSEASRLPKALGVRVWDRAIPQLEVGHQKRLDTVKDSLTAEGVKGLYLAGNYVGGVALGRCVEFGLEIAKEVVDFVKEAKVSQPA